MERLGKTLAITSCGILTSIATAAVLAWLELKFNIAFYAFTLWFILPIGAVVAGMGAGSGYGLAARYLQYRPGKLLALNIVLVSSGTYFLLHYLVYSSRAI